MLAQELNRRSCLGLLPIKTRKGEFLGALHFTNMNMNQSRNTPLLQVISRKGAEYFLGHLAAREQGTSGSLYAYCPSGHFPGATAYSWSRKWASETVFRLLREAHGKFSIHCRWKRLLSDNERNPQIECSGLRAGEQG